MRHGAVESLVSATDESTWRKSTDDERRALENEL